MAKYMLLIYGDERQWESMTPEQSETHDAGHVAFRNAGARIEAAGELELASTATTVRAAPGESSGGPTGDRNTGGTVTTDGPFLETKEALGGFYVIEAKDLDEVLALVDHLPEVHAAHGGIEIRPLVDHG